MQDYGKRLLIALLVALCISLLFIGGTYSQAAENKTELPGEFIWPAKGVITDYFGTRGGTHKGIDIAAPLNTAIIAAHGGIVSKAYHSHTYGNVVFINHEDKYETVYAHLNRLLVKEGDKVQTGQLIGRMGTTGRSSGVHLHFEIHKDKWTMEKEMAFDPLNVLNDNHTQVSGIPKDDGSHDQLDTFHLVKQGETLWGISQTVHVSVEKLKEWNQLETDIVQTGQQLKISRDRSSEVSYLQN